MSVKLHPYRHYRFSAHYTRTYMRASVSAIGRELACRTDIHPAWLYELGIMAAACARSETDQQIRMITFTERFE